MANNEKRNAVQVFIDSQNNVKTSVKRHSVRIRNNEYLVVSELENQIKTPSGESRSVYTFTRVSFVKNGASVDMVKKALSASFYAKTTNGLAALDRVVARDSDGDKRGYVYSVKGITAQSVRVSDNRLNVKRESALADTLGVDELATNPLYLEWLNSESKGATRTAVQTLTVVYE